MKRKPPRHGKLREARDRKKFRKQLDKALDLLNSSALAEGYQIIRQLARAHPNHPEVHYAFGAYHLLQGDYQQAVEYFNRATDLKPDFAQAHYNKAAAYKELLEIKPAIRAFQKVLEYGKSGEECVRLAREFLDGFAGIVKKEDGATIAEYLEGGDAFDAGVAAMQQRDWETAIRHFEHSLELTPRHAQSHGNIGLCYLQQGRKHAALGAFDRALEIDPRYELARANRRRAESLQEGDIPAQQDIPMIDYYGDTFKKNQRE